MVDDAEGHTDPVQLASGAWVYTRAELEPLLSEAEGRGRTWLLERQRDARAQGLATLDRVPRVLDVYALHRAMFDPIFDWAGQQRRTVVNVGNCDPEHITTRLAELMSQLHGWVEYASPIDTASIARIVADFHHGFVQIHPFPDTNGRTARVLDHYLLWVTFDLGSPGALPVLEHFPSEPDKKTYLTALRAADAYDSSLIHAFYEERFTAAMNALAAVLEPR